MQGADSLESRALLIQESLHAFQLVLKELDAAPQDGLDTVEKLILSSRISGRVILAAERAALALYFEKRLDLSQAEPDDFSQTLDESQAFDILVVVATIAAGDVRGWLEEPELLVIADGPRRQPGHVGHIADAAQVRRDRRGQAARHLSQYSLFLTCT